MNIFESLNTFLYREIDREDAYDMFLNKNEELIKRINKDNVDRHIEFSFKVRNDEYIKYLFCLVDVEFGEEYLVYAKNNIDLLQFFLSKYNRETILSFKKKIKSLLLSEDVPHALLNFLTTDIECDVSEIIYEGITILSTCVSKFKNDHPLFEDERYLKYLINSQNDILSSCIDGGRLDIIEKIIDFIDKPSEKDEFLFRAIERKHYHIADFLYERGYFLNERNIFNMNENYFQLNYPLISKLDKYGFRLYVDEKIKYKGYQIITRDKLEVMSSFENFDDYIYKNRFYLLKNSQDVETLDYITSRLN